MPFKHVTYPIIYNIQSIYEKKMKLTSVCVYVLIGNLLFININYRRMMDRNTKICKL